MTLLDRCCEATSALSASVLTPNWRPCIELARRLRLSPDQQHQLFVQGLSRPASLLSRLYQAQQCKANPRSQAPSAQARPRAPQPLEKRMNIDEKRRAQGIEHRENDNDGGEPGTRRRAGDPDE